MDARHQRSASTEASLATFTHRTPLYLCRLGGCRNQWMSTADIDVWMGICRLIHMQQACMYDVREPKCSMPGPGSAPKKAKVDRARPGQCSTIFVPPGRLPQSLHRLYGHTWPGYMDINAVPTFPQLSMLLQPSSDPIHHRKPIGNLPRTCRTPIEHLSIYRTISHNNYI